MVREIVHFAVFNLAEVPVPEDVEALADRVRGRSRGMRDRFAGVDVTDGAAGIVRSLEERLPVLRRLGEIRWLGERLDRLYRSLPEAVVAAGGMGKVVRTMMGVLLIGAYDTRHAENPWRGRISSGSCRPRTHTAPPTRSSTTPCTTCPATT